MSYEQPKRDAKGRFLPKASQPKQPKKSMKKNLAAEAMKKNSEAIAREEEAIANETQPTNEPQPMSERMKLIEEEKHAKTVATKGGKKLAVVKEDENIQPKSVYFRMTPPGVPIMVCLDGMDGSGKSVVLSNIMRILQECFGKTVMLLDAPNYNTPGGQVVWDYLHEGIGDVWDRGVAALWYAADRNKIMHQQFQKIFKPGSGIDVVLANRWALSSLTYQTTLYPGPTGPEKNSHPAQIVTAGEMPTPWSIYSFEFDYDEGVNYHVSSLGINLGAMYFMAFMDAKQCAEYLHVHEAIGKVVQPICRWVAPYLRARMVAATAELIYKAEIQPWAVRARSTTGNGEHDWLYRPFEYINYVSLVGSPATMLKNVAKRNRGGQGADIMEADTVQLGVLENIMYLHNDFLTPINALPCDIAFSNLLSNSSFTEMVQTSLDVLNNLKIDGVKCRFAPSQLPFGDMPKFNRHSFDFSIVNATTGTWEKHPDSEIAFKWANGSRMRPIRDVVKDVWQASGLKRVYGPIPDEFKCSL